MARSGGLKASGTTGAQECTPVFTDINQKKMFVASAVRSPDGCFSWAEFGNLPHRTGAGIQKKRPVKIASESYVFIKTKVAITPDTPRFYIFTHGSV